MAGTGDRGAASNNVAVPIFLGGVGLAGGRPGEPVAVHLVDPVVPISCREHQLVVSELHPSAQGIPG
jgi:hypothetical protein